MVCRGTSGKFITGNDGYTKTAIDSLGLAALLQKTGQGWMWTNEDYAAAYLAVKYLDKQIRSSGASAVNGVNASEGIKHLTTWMKTQRDANAGATASGLNQYIETHLNAAHGYGQGYPSDTSGQAIDDFLADFESANGQAFVNGLNLTDADSGSIMGSEYGGAVLLASDVIPDDSSYILGYNSNLNYNDNSSFMENQAVGTIVGDFNATDPDGDELTYHLVSGAGDDNNSLFILDTNGRLKTAAVLDYEAGSNLSIRIQVRDEYNASVEGNFTVALYDANDPATGTITISGTAEVGQTLTASNNLADADGLGTITYQWYCDGQLILYGGTLKDGVNGVDGLGGVKSLAPSVDGNHAYIVGSIDDAVGWYERNASTGALTYGGVLKNGLNGVDGLDGVRSVTLSADGNHAYTTGYDANAVSWYERNASTRALTYGGVLKNGLNGVDGLDGANAVVLSADGNHAYVAGGTDDAVSWYERNASTGALTYGGMLKNGVNGVDGLDGASSVTLSSDGNHAYVAAASDDAVSW